MTRTVALLLALGGCREPIAPAQAQAEAQRIWSERCSNCHGPGGRGDGPGARLLPKPPRNFADAQWQSTADDARIAQVIVDGGPALGLDTNMAANPDLRRKPEVVAALVEIVRGF